MSLLLLALQRFGMRMIEAVVLLLVATIGACYFIEIFVLPQVRPDFLEIGHAFLSPSLRQVGMIYVAIGIVGATVMPSTCIPCTRPWCRAATLRNKDDASIRSAIRFNTIDSVHRRLSVAFLRQCGDHGPGSARLLWQPRPAWPWRAATDRHL